MPMCTRFVWVGGSIKAPQKAAGVKNDEIRLLKEENAALSIGRIQINSTAQSGSTLDRISKFGGCPPCLNFADKTLR